MRFIDTHRQPVEARPVTIDHQALRHELARGVARNLVARHGDALVSVVLFGSVARGAAKDNSDIDLVLVFRDPPRSRDGRFRLFWDALGALEDRRVELARMGIGVDWSPIVLSVAEARHRSRLYLDLVDEAELLVDHDGFFQAVLDDMRARLIEIGATKTTYPDGSGCWDLNPLRLPLSQVIL